MGLAFNKKQYFGFTLVELMVSLAVGSLIALAAVSAFTAQSAVIIEETLRMNTEEQGREVHAVLTRLLLQAHRSSLPQNTVNDEINFTVPAGVAIWPNDQEAPFDKNAIRISFDSSAHTISIGNGVPTGTDLSQIVMNNLTVLSGDSTGVNPRIIAMTLTPDADNIRYTFTITSQAGNRADIKATFVSSIIPRN